ncbi:MAG: GGDEF domain-containing protein [Planctomycetota bacterium]|jgi:diguanylate cyclase
MEQAIPWVAAAIVIVVGIALFRRKGGRPVLHAGTLHPDRVPTVVRTPDPREKRLEHSAETVRSVLVSLLDILRNADSAAGDSTVALNEARTRINNIKVAGNLQEADALLDELDRMISANSTLRQKLNESQDALREQQGQIATLQTAVRVDALTQVGNRAAFEEQLEQAMERLDRYGETFSLLMLDLDHFKRINDTYGHPAGDRVLKGLAIKLKAALRGSDFISRYGGEEFAAILLRSAGAEALETAEKVRDAVETLKLTLDRVAVRITVSIGVAEAVAGESGEALVARADAALYASKQAGRNCVRLASADGATVLQPEVGR